MSQKKFITYIFKSKINSIETSYRYSNYDIYLSLTKNISIKTKPNQTWPNQAKLNQTKQNSTCPNQSKLMETKPNQTRRNQTKTNSQIKFKKIK